jgi:hypothetical protein
MADLGTRLTDVRMRGLDKRLQGVYGEALKTALEREKAAIERLANIKKQLQEMGVTEDYERMFPAWGQKVLRETNLVNNIAAELAKSGETAARMIQGEMLNIYGLNMDFSRYSIDSQAGVFLRWDIYDKNQLKVLLDSERSPFTKIAYKKLGQDKQIVQRLQNQMAQATILGESQQQIIRRIRDVTGQSVKQARRVAQTERTRVQSQGRNMAIMEAVDMGIAMQKVWIARMVNTRDTHEELNGVTVDAAEPFVTSAGNELMFPGDPNAPGEEVINCHCVEKPQVKNVPQSILHARYNAGMKIDERVSFEEWRVKYGN